MESIFVVKELWKTVIGTEMAHEEGEEIFKRKNKIVIDVILAAIDMDNLPTSYHFIVQVLQNTDSAEDAWKLLTELHEKGPEEVQQKIKRAKNQRKKLKRKEKKEKQHNKTISLIKEPALDVENFRHQSLPIIVRGDMSCLTKGMDNVILVCVEKLIGRIQMVTGHTVIGMYCKISIISLNSVTFSTLTFEEIKIIAAYPRAALESCFQGNIRRISCHQVLAYQIHITFWIGYLTMKVNQIEIMFHVCISIIRKYMHVSIMEILIVLSSWNFLSDTKKTGCITQLAGTRLNKPIDPGEDNGVLTIDNSSLHLDNDDIANVYCGHSHTEAGRKKQVIEGMFKRHLEDMFDEYMQDHSELSMFHYLDSQLCVKLKEAKSEDHQFKGHYKVEDQDHAQDMVFKIFPRSRRWRFKEDKVH